MGKKYGTQICEVNDMFVIYRSEDQKYSIYIKEMTSSGRRRKKLLKSDIDQEEEALSYCRQIIEKVYSKMQN